MADEGGYWARALGHAIFTEAKTWEELRANVLEATSLHLEEDAAARPGLVQLWTPGLSVRKAAPSGSGTNSSSSITIPLHSALKTGTLYSILSEVAHVRSVAIESLIEML